MTCPCNNCCLALHSVIVESSSAVICFLLFIYIEIMMSILEENRNKLSYESILYCWSEPYLSGGSTPRRDHARTDVATPPGPWRPLGRFPVGVDCSPNDLLRQSFLGHSGHMAELAIWDLSIRTSDLTTRALPISDLCSLSWSVTPRTLRKFPISAVYSFDSILSVVT